LLGPLRITQESIEGFEARVIWLNLILGAWLIIAPAFIGSFTTRSVAVANDLALGLFLIAASWWILASTTAQLPVSDSNSSAASGSSSRRSRCGIGNSSTRP
jgi:hypothetical protein